MLFWWLLEVVGFRTAPRSSASRRTLQANLLYLVPDRWLGMCYRVSLNYI
jgi:hypothetical protein